MTEAELQNKVLQYFYEKRFEGMTAIRCTDIDPTLGAIVFGRICKQLKDLRLIEWKPAGRSMTSPEGMGHITANGVAETEKQSHIQVQTAQSSARGSNSSSRPPVFVSHSHADCDTVTSLIDTLNNGLHLPGNTFFCSSVPGMGIANGKRFIDYIRETIHETKLVIFMISTDFMKSPYCLAESGAAWVKSVDQFILVIPPLEKQELGGVFDGIQAAKISENYALNELKDRICNAVFPQPKVNPNHWERVRDEFLHYVAKAPSLMEEEPERDEGETTTTSANHVAIDREFVKRLRRVCSPVAMKALFCDSDYSATFALAAYHALERFRSFANEAESRFLDPKLETLYSAFNAKVIDMIWALQGADASDANAEVLRFPKQYPEDVNEHEAYLKGWRERVDRAQESSSQLYSAYKNLIHECRLILHISTVIEL
jgi:TIR domain